MKPTRNELQLVSGQKMESFWSAQLTWELHRVLEDDDSSSKLDTGRVRKEGDETVRIYSGFGSLSDFEYLSGSITFRCNCLSGACSPNSERFQGRGSSLMLSGHT